MSIALKHTAKILLGLICLSVQAHAGVAIVTSPKNPVSAIDIDDVRKIYLGKTRTYPNNKPAVPVDQDSSNPLYEEFLSKVIEKNAKEMKAYWSVRIFTGRDTPPSQLDSDADVKEWLQKNPEGIGYINSNAVDGSVKVLLKIP